jgi:hypothetical protein
MSEVQRAPCDFQRHRTEPGTCECEICGWHIGDKDCPNARPDASRYGG